MHGVHSWQCFTLESARSPFGVRVFGHCVLWLCVVSEQDVVKDLQVMHAGGRQAFVRYTILPFSCKI